MDTPEGKKCWIFSMKVDGFPAFSTKGFEAVKATEQQQLDEEKIRLLYVAATRARNAIIVADARTSKGERSESNPWAPFLEIADGDFFETYTDASIVYTAEQKTVTELYDEEHRIAHLDTVPAPTFALQKPSEHKSSPAVAREEETETDELQPLPARSEDGLSAAKRGTMVHRLMELMVCSKNRMEPETAIRQIMDEQGITDPRPAQMLRTVAQKIRSGGYAQPNGSNPDILQELLSAQEVHCEVPFCRMVSDGPLPVLTNGIMDVIYRKDGAWHIVDYKTNESAENLETLYRDQLTAYITAFRELSGETTDARIYHIDC